MTMPINLMLVRHGQSEGNIANKRSRTGDHSAFTPEFMNRHSSKFRLSDKGRRQAEAAGEWIRKEFTQGFDRYYVSEYLRAMETAGLLRIKNASWRLDFYLRERDYGEMDVMPQNILQQKYAESLKRRDLESFLWIPPNGEILPTVCLRMDRVFDTFHRECSDKNVIVVCHGDAMWAMRVRLERISQYDFQRLENSQDPFDHIHNCQILHYTRRNPWTQELMPYLGWFRSVCPWDDKLSSNRWRPIMRQKYSNEDLLETVNQTPQLVFE